MPRIKKNKRVVHSSNNSNPTPNFGELQRSLIELVNITPPQAGGNVIITLPVGGSTYEKVVVPTNIPEDKIREIKVLIDDKTIWEFEDAEELRALSLRYNESVQASGGVDQAIVFNFERLHLETLKEKKALGLGTVGIQKASISFRISQDIEEANPRIQAYAFVGRASTLGLIRIIRKVPFTSAVGGELSIVNPFLVNKVNQAKVMAIHFLRDDISKVKIIRGATISHNYTKSINKFHLRSAGRTPDNNTFMIDFCSQNTIAGALTYSDTAGSFITIKPTIPDVGGRCNMLVEYVGTAGSA